MSIQLTMEIRFRWIISITTEEYEMSRMQHKPWV